MVALDIGGTKLTVGLVDQEGRRLATQVRPTDQAASPARIVDALFAMAESALAATALAWTDVAAVGGSYGGPLDYPAGRTVTCHHLPGWEDVPLRELVARRAGRPAVVDNDANAAALGEAVFGAARGCAHVLHLNVGTGIGGGVVIGGRLHRGADSMAGEVGHTLVAPDGPLCTCGRRGCLEAVAAGPAIVRAAQEALRSGEPSCLATLPVDEITGRHVAEAAGQDALAARVMQQAGKWIGLAIAAAVNLLNPHMVVIGGGVAGAGEALFAPLRAAVSSHAVPEATRRLRIVPGALGPWDALLGAAALALQEGIG